MENISSILTPDMHFVCHYRISGYPCRQNYLMQIRSVSDKEEAVFYDSAWKESSQINFLLPPFRYCSFKRTYLYQEVRKRMSFFWARIRSLEKWTRLFKYLIRHISSLMLDLDKKRNPKSTEHQSEDMAAYIRYQNPIKNNLSRFAWKHIH